ncbi:MAG TPA: glycosyltransferase family 39 protein [Gemmataceae bacterium]|nr:glycosyltransferase family 39 protein [Gemmataceae bacterium]
MPFTQLTWFGLAIVGVLSVAPFFLDPHPTKLAPPQHFPLGWITKGSVLLCMLLTIGLRAWADRDEERRPILLNGGFLLLAVALTAYHWFEVDRGWFDVKEGRKTVRYYHVNWQRALYAAVLNHRPESHGENWVPHIYRPAPYGFVRSLELYTGDWRFACLVYRGFFTYWFVWCTYRFIRRFHRPKEALAGLGVYAILYPFSVLYYMGQLTDPMSHALFALALLCLIEDRWRLLGVSLALGILAKETAIVLVPAYAACWRGRGPRTYLRTGVLGLIGVAAFLAVRLPFGWTGASDSINGSKIMVAQNLGFGDASFGTSAPLYQNYLQPILFIGLFLPIIWKHWRDLDSRLKALFLTLVPLVFLSSLAFSWLYESRNYVPLLPVLLAMTQRPVTGSSDKKLVTRRESQYIVQEQRTSSPIAGARDS